MSEEGSVEEERKDFIITPSREENYNKALAFIDKAKVVYATYLVPSPPDPDRPPQPDVEEYWRRWEERLEAGDLTYWWILSIESEEKFDCLIKRILRILEKTPEAVSAGRSKLRVILNTDLLPMFNFQVCDENNAVVGFAVETDEIDYGFYTYNRDFVHKLHLFFLKMWAKAIPVIDGKVHYDGIRRIGTKISIPEETLNEYIREVESMEKWAYIGRKIEGHIKINPCLREYILGTPFTISVEIKNKSSTVVSIQEIKNILPDKCSCQVPDTYLRGDKDIVARPKEGIELYPNRSYEIRLECTPTEEGEAIINPEVVLKEIPGRTIQLGGLRLIFRRKKVGTKYR